MIERFMRFLASLFSWGDELPAIEYETRPPTMQTNELASPPEPPKPAPEPPLPPAQPEPPPPPPPPSKGLILYHTAKSCLGKDMAATQNELGCAEAVNAVHKLAFGKTIGGGVSTALMYAALQKHAAFKKVSSPAPGDIIISPTGTSTKGAKHGHVGIVGNTHIMSNNSMTGKWDAYYTPASWKAYYGTKLGFPTYYYRPI